MTKPDAKQAVRETEPTTKAAQLREVMPEIEEKLAAGVQLGTIHKALTDAGFDLTFQTLKTYLYRYRKKVRTSEIPAKLTKSSITANSNSPVGHIGEDKQLPCEVSSSLADALDARKRDQLGDKYLNRQKPIFNKQSDKK
ncbi:conjugal transfer protein TraD [Xylella fastidiosa]|uniref:conjugal transfer protein TraD n=1 Tax=Xylella fastidiosa TaxID=2371 RepID=UPI000FFF2AAD|nr:conjugal transfer protein TraD [Xylella fastidiosa]RWA36896.1 conjugal transfer protein TraD [Xylella fastidiosa subsp. multiplex]